MLILGYKTQYILALAYLFLACLVSPNHTQFLECLELFPCLKTLHSHFCLKLKFFLTTFN